MLCSHVTAASRGPCTAESPSFHQDRSSWRRGLQGDVAERADSAFTPELLAERRAGGRDLGWGSFKFTCLVVFEKKV